MIVLGVLVISAVNDLPSPARLEGARFYRADFVRKVRSQEFHPFDHWTASPQHVLFPAPGVLEVQYGQESIRCRFSARGRGAKYTLRSACAGNDLGEVEWTWLPNGGVLTDLFDAPGNELTRLDKPYPELVRVYESAYAKKTFAALAGTWGGRRGAQLVIRANGTVTLNGRVGTADLKECLPMQSEDLPRVPCLILGSGPGKETVFALLEGATWVEGHIPEVLAISGRPFETLEGGASFERAKAPALHEH